MYGLTSEEKTRIEQEEQVRHNMRRLIADRETKGLWGKLDMYVWKPGITLAFTTILSTLIGYALGYAKSGHDSSTNAALEKMQLRKEISLRLDRLRTRMIDLAQKSHDDLADEHSKLHNSQLLVKSDECHNGHIRGIRIRINEADGGISDFPKWNGMRLDWLFELLSTHLASLGEAGDSKLAADAAKEWKTIAIEFRGFEGKGDSRFQLQQDNKFDTRQQYYDDLRNQMKPLFNVLLRDPNPWYDVKAGTLFNESSAAYKFMNSNGT